MSAGACSYHLYPFPYGGRGSKRKIARSCLTFDINTFYLFSFFADPCTDKICAGAASLFDIHFPHSSYTARRTDALPKKGASILLFYSLFCRYSSSVWLTTELAVLENASLRVRQQAEPLYLHHLHRSSFSGFYGECFCSSFIVLCGSRRIPLGHSSPHANAPVSRDLLLWKIFRQVLPQGRQLRCGYYLFQKPFSWYPPR